MHFRHLAIVFCLLFWGIVGAWGQAAPPAKKKKRKSSFRKVKAADKTKEFINLPNYDEKTVHYGFFLALNYTNFRVKPSREFVEGVITAGGSSNPNPLYNINPIGSAGFTTGFILNVRAAQHFDVRFLPTVSFYQRYLEFRFLNDSISNQLNQSTFSFVELPLLLKFKSERRRNTRMYFIGGIKPAIEVGAKRDEIDDTFLRATSSDFSIDYGFGIDIYYPLFKFSPEIRFSHGLSNLRQNDGNIYSRSLTRLTSHTITLYLNFE